MNAYEAKQEARRERLEARADRLRGEASSAFKRADLSEAATGIPFGQPILVGHHSEGRHRAVIARANRALDKGIALNKAANEAASRAASVGSGGISSDDPDAVAKLRAELAKLEDQHAKEKAINVAIRKNAKAGREAQIAAIVALGFSAGLAGKLLEPPYPGGPIGIPSYSLSNRSANMSRIKDRIAYLERIAAQRAAAPEPIIVKESVAGLEIIENLEANRLQLGFPGKPPASVIAVLKARGFRWAPSVGFWQRHLSNGAKWAAESVEQAWKDAQPQA
jgi:hypothetical protein